MATASYKNKLLIDGYIRELYSSKAAPKEINDLFLSFYFIMIESEMLTNEEEEQLLKWIDDSNECDFKLLYKATRDGFGSEEFHKKCDGKGANISIIRSEHECIFGGYTSASWHNKGKDISDDYAWLYSLRNKEGIQKNFKIVKNKRLAMGGYGDYGPMYGGGGLVISNDCNQNKCSYTYLGRCYEEGSDPFQLNDGTMYFKVLDYEIWQIIKK